MGYLIEIFGGLTVGSVIILIAAITFLAKISIKVYKFIVKNHDLIQEREQVLVDVKNELADIKTKQTSLEDNVTIIISKQQELAARQEAIEEANKVHNRNKLRDRLLQNYNYYCNMDKNPMLAWSEMEKEAFDKLFEDYELLGGNGYMHSEVAPKMASLTVIKMNNSQDITNLMQSRKG